MKNWIPAICLPGLVAAGALSCGQRNDAKSTSAPAKTVTEDKHVSTSAAAQRDEETVRVGEENDRVAPPEESACLTHRTPIRESKTETVRFRNTRDTLITLEKGIRIQVPARVFTVAGKPVGNNWVTLKLREYTEMADFILGDLPTVARGGKILNTGGSVYLEARCNNEECAVQQGKYIQVQFPVKGRYRKDMETFEGVPDHKKNIIWDLPLSRVLMTRDSVEVKVSKAGTTYSQFMKGKMSLEEYISANTHLTPNRTPKIPVDNVYINFDINTQGRPENIKITGAEDYLLQNKLTNTVKFMPDWEPFLFKSGVKDENRPDREYVPVKMGISIKIQIDNVAGKVLFAKDEQSRKGEIAEPKVESYYRINTNMMGYVNCDRFMNATEELVNVQVDARELNGARAFLVFKDNPAIMKHYYEAGKMFFRMIPVGTEAYLVWARKEGDDYFVTIRDFKTTKEPIRITKEEKMSEEEMSLAIRKKCLPRG